MQAEQIETAVHRDIEPAFYEHLESMLEAGITELKEQDRTYQVSVRRGESRVPYFVLQLV